MKKLIGKGQRGEIYDIGNNRVEKITSDKSEYEIALKLVGEDHEYIANYISAVSLGDNKYSIIKEKIQPNTSIKNALLNLENKWDEEAVSGYNLIDYLKKYLTLPSSLLINKVSIKKFIYTLDDKEKKLFLQLIDLIEYLKSIQIQNLDLHVDNIGIKNGHLALFELGGASFIK